MNSKEKSNIGWYINRLSVMKPAEMINRIGRQCSIKGLEISFRLNRANPKRGLEIPDHRSFSFCSGANHKLPDLPFSFRADSDEARDALQGKLYALGFDSSFLSDPPSWSLAPDTGKNWPQRTFFGSIPYRNGNPYGDIRVVWESSRLQNLITLALIVKEGDPAQKENAISLLENQFISWVSENPILDGIHYISAMECGLRIIAVCHALDLVRNHLLQPELIWPALVQMVEEHAGLIEKRLSLYSSKGNHTVAESAALIYTGVLFPEMKGAGRWREKGLSILGSEAQYQILPDGGGVEQSFNYLAFISDLLGLVIKMLEHNRFTVPQEIKLGFIRGRRFLSRMADNSKSLPSVGDSDNGFALSKYLNFESDESRKNPRIETFSDSGYTLFRNQDNAPATLIFDHGPLGMPPCNGHGHADALSVIFKLGDKEILIDPGTYTYNGDPSWRSYFKSTSAHNTVTVDEADQAVQKASFIWAEPYQSRIISSETTPKGVFRIVARHNGYSRLKEGVEHFRGISCVPTGYWLIWDYITGKGVHTLDLNWHLACDFVQGGGEYRILNLIHPVSLSIQGGETVAHSGSTDPILGWNSPMYGVKEAITTLQTRYRGTLPHEFLTRIKIHGVPQLSFFESTERFILKGWTI